MSVILVGLNRDGTPFAAADVERMLVATRHRAVHGERVVVLGAAALAHQHFWSAPEDVGTVQPFVAADGSAIVFDGRLDNRAEIAHDLGDRAPPPDAPDALFALAAYRQWRRACAGRLLGDFAFAVWDPAARRFFLARDALGARSLSYVSNDRQFLACTSVAALLAHPAVPDTIDDVKVAQYLVCEWLEPWRTFFSHVRHLPPAHALTASATDTAIDRYWDLDHERRHRLDDRAAATEIGRLLQQSVADRLRSIGPTAISLSGGIDSSAVAAVAAPLVRLRPEGRLRSYSYVFDRFPESDERQWIEQTVERVGLNATYLPGDESWTLRDPERWPVRLDFVDFDAYRLLPVAVRAAARADGCRLLLTGHLGDVLFHGAEYWVADMLRSRRVADLARAACTARHHLSWRGDVVDRGLRPFLPARLRAAYRSVRPRSLAERSPAISRALASRSGVTAALDLPTLMGKPRLELAARVADLRLGMRPEAMAATRDDFEAIGLEWADPFYDRRLVEFCMALPADQLGLPGSSRRALRLAVADRLPPSVVHRVGKSGTAPLLRLGLLVRERAFVLDLLRDPLVVEFDYVDRDWLQDELARGEQWTAGGFHLWLVTALELWLRRRRESGPRTD